MSRALLSRMSVTLLLSVALALVVGCPAPDEDGDGGAGGDGGMSGTGATPGTGGSGAMVGSGGTGGTALTCDDGTPPSSGADCLACTTCASEGPCGDLAAYCGASATCDSFATCLNDNCAAAPPAEVDACIDDCAFNDPEGSTMFFGFQSCTLCECPVKCEELGDQCVDALVCDAGGEADETECDDCLTCATAGTGPCTVSESACSAEPQCDQFGDCIGLCQPGDDPCFDACVLSFPTGNELYRELSACVCSQCPNDCSGLLSVCDLFLGGE